MRRQAFDVLVIGGGIAGLMAVWQAARWGLSAGLIEMEPLFGGQIANTFEVEGLPMMAVSGTILATSLVDQARELHAAIFNQKVIAIQPGDPLHNVDIGQQLLRSRFVIVATGRRPRKLAVPGEDEFTGRGISHCSTCDAPLFKDKDVVVVGGGDAALQGALYLSTMCRSVQIICRGALRAKQTLIERATRTSNIAFLWDSTIEEIHGNGVMTGITVQTNRTTSRVLECAGLFPFIGGTPHSDFLAQDIARDQSGGLKTNDAYETSIRRIYSVGAVRHGYSGELSSAIGEAAGAVHNIAQCLRA